MFQLMWLGVATLALGQAGNAESVKVLDGHTSAAFSGDGTRVAAISSTKPHHSDTLKIWDVSTGEELVVISSKALSFLQLRFTPDGKNLITSHYDKTVKIWDAAHGKETASYGPLQQQVPRLLVSRNGERLYALAYDLGSPVGARELKAWQLPAGKELFAIRQAEDSIVRHPTQLTSLIQLHFLELSPDGKFLAAPCDTNGRTKSNVIKLWDADTGKETLSMPHASWQPIAFSPDGKRLASVDRPEAKSAIRLWEIPSGKARTLGTLGGDRDVRMIVFSPDGKWLALASYKRIDIVDADSGKPLHALQSDTAIHHIAFSPKSDLLAAGCGDPNEIFGSRGDVKVWALSSGKLRHAFRGQRGFAQWIAFNRDGNRLISFNPASLILWKVEQH